MLNLIGLAMKAGHVVSGEFSVEKYIKSGKAKLQKRNLKINVNFITFQ